jgi:hypothetical protein
LKFRRRDIFSLGFVMLERFTVLLVVGFLAMIILNIYFFSFIARNSFCKCFEIFFGENSFSGFFLDLRQGIVFHQAPSFSKRYSL